MLIERQRTRSQTKRSSEVDEVEAGLHQLGMVDEYVDSLLRPVGPPLLAALGLIISDAAPIDSTRLSGWLDDNADGFGPLVHLRARAHLNEPRVGYRMAKGEMQEREEA